jgi:hypothetical protein
MHFATRVMTKYQHIGHLWRCVAFFTTPLQCQYQQSQRPTDAVSHAGGKDSIGGQIQTIVQWNSAIWEHMCVYKFLLRMADAMTSQNTDPSSWDTLYNFSWSHWKGTRWGWEIWGSLQLAASLNKQQTVLNKIKTTLTVRTKICDVMLAASRESNHQSRGLRLALLMGQPEHGPSPTSTWWKQVTFPKRYITLNITELLIEKSATDWQSEESATSWDLHLRSQENSPTWELRRDVSIQTRAIET